MRMTTSFWSVGGGVILAAAASHATAATVTLDSQNREVSVRIPALTDTINGTNIDSIDEAIVATDFGPFLADLDRTVDITDPGLGVDQLSTARSTQDSSFTADGPDLLLQAAGSSRYSSAGTTEITFADSDFEVVFTVDDFTSFSISGSGTYTDTGGGASGFNVYITQFALGDVFTAFGNGSLGPDGDGDLENVPFDHAGTLAPGTYTFRASSGVSGGPSGGNTIFADYDATLRLVNVIPTPAAFPAAVMLLGAMLHRRPTRQ